MTQTIYLTAWKDSHMLPQGFKAVVRPDAFRWVEFGESHEAEAAELEGRLTLALALLDSVGIEAHFASAPGDSHGEQPEEGYVSTATASLEHDYLEIGDPSEPPVRGE